MKEIGSEYFCKSSFLFKIQVDFFGEIACLSMALCRVEGRRDFISKRICWNVRVHPNVKNLFRFAKKLSSYNENLPGVQLLIYLFFQVKQIIIKKAQLPIKTFWSLEGLAYKSSNPFENGSLLPQRKRKIAADEIQIILYLSFINFKQNYRPLYSEIKRIIPYCSPPFFIIIHTQCPISPTHSKWR